ncbi:MAG: hypothetical protein AAF514_10650, partial [Verrucomicrobiota bacterium]
MSRRHSILLACGLFLPVLILAGAAVRLTFGEVDRAEANLRKELGLIAEAAVNRMAEVDPFKQGAVQMSLSNLQTDVPEQKYEHVAIFDDLGKARAYLFRDRREDALGLLEQLLK